MANKLYSGSQNFQPDLVLLDLQMPVMGALKLSGNLAADTCPWW